MKLFMDMLADAAIYAGVLMVIVGIACAMAAIILGRMPR